LAIDTLFNISFKNNSLTDKKYSLYGAMFAPIALFLLVVFIDIILDFFE